jgi:hypothetical protein
MVTSSVTIISPHWIGTDGGGEKNEEKRINSRDYFDVSMYVICTS